MSQSRAWVFTHNNPNDQKPEEYLDTLGVRFLAYQHEIAPATGTHHLQGYVIFMAPKRLAALKKVNASIHWEVRKGSHEEAVDYVSKAESRQEGSVPYCKGEAPRQGRRSDLESLKEALDSDLSLAEVADAHFGSFIRYHKGLMLYRSLRTNPRSEHTFCQVYYGESGAGKSYRAAYEAGPSAYYLPPPNQSTGAVWWDGYTGQEVVVIDEFYGWISHQFMLRLCDRSPINVQTKGGNVPFVSKKIIITSNKSPAEWWPRSGLGAMARRLRDPLGSVVHMRLGPGGAHWRPPELGNAQADEVEDPEQYASSDQSNGFT